MSKVPTVLAPASQEDVIDSSQLPGNIHHGGRQTRTKLRTIKASSKWMARLEWGILSKPRMGGGSAAHAATAIAC